MKETLEARLRELAEYARKPGDPEAVGHAILEAAEEVAALEELKGAVTRWRDSHGGSREEFQAKVDMVAALERLKTLEAQR